MSAMYICHVLCPGVVVEVWQWGISCCSTGSMLFVALLVPMFVLFPCMGRPCFVFHIAGESVGRV